MADGRRVKSDLETGPLRKYVHWIDKKLNFKISVHHFFTFVGQRTPRINVFYYCYRWLIFLLCLMSSIITFGDLGNPIKKYKRDARFHFMYFIYMTNLSLTLNTVQVTFGVLIMTICVHRYKFGESISLSEEVGCFRIVYWKLHELTVMVALSVSTTYWLIVYPVSAFEADLNNILGHATNSAFAVLDWALTGVPYKSSASSCHFWWMNVDCGGRNHLLKYILLNWIIFLTLLGSAGIPSELQIIRPKIIGLYTYTFLFLNVWMGWLYGTCYFTFNLVYWEFGGYPRPAPRQEKVETHVLYPNCTDWSNAKQSFLCYLGFICIVCMWHLVLCALNRIRIILWKERLEDLRAPESSES